MKKIAILGSTGSIGKSSLKVIEHLPNKFQVYLLVAGKNIDLLEEQILRFSPKLVAVYDKEKAAELQKRRPNSKILAGIEGVLEAVTDPNIDFVISAIVGTAGLLPTVAAIEAGKNIGLANKEVLVSAGEFVTSLAKKKGVGLIPIDSEHSALFQCLNGEKQQNIRRLILTASGGPFRNYSQKQLENVKLEEALNHPTWNMGPKVTVDSSTLMNKGLEMIEAHWLFGVPPEKIETVVHPESIIHSMVDFIDGSIIAQLNAPDMVNPIQYAMSYPERYNGMFKPFDFTKFSQLNFSPPDRERFRCLDLAQQAMKEGVSMPCYMNAANEILVERFLNKEIQWNDIASMLEKLMLKHQVQKCHSLDSIMDVDREARREAQLI